MASLQGLRNHLELTPRNAAFLMFVFAFALRLIPEIIAGIWPIGFDTITYYTPTVISLSRGHFDLAYFDSYAPLGYFVILMAYLISNNIFLSLKLVGPLFYGFFVLSFFLFQTKGLNWSVKKSMVGSLLFALYFLTLRIGWDLYRNMLGLTFLLFLLPFLRNFNEQTVDRKLLASLLIIGAVLSHEIAGFLALSVTIGSLLLDAIRKKRKAIESAKMSLWFMPALILFILIILTTAIEFQLFPGGVSYFDNVSRGFTYESYSVLVLDILSLFILVFSLILPLVFYGFFRDRALDLWALICLAGSFWPLICPWFEVVPWNRWMLMLDIPFVLYATNGLAKFHLRRPKNNINPHLQKRRVLLYLFFFVVAGISISYLILPQSLSPYPAFASFERLSFYIPGGLLSNTFPITDNYDLVRSFEWVNQHMNNETVLIVHESLRGWAMIYLNEDGNVLNYHFQSHRTGLAEALSAGFKRVYLIWWIDNYGWYGQKSVPEAFGQPVFTSLRIGVFSYVQS